MQPFDFFSVTQIVFGRGEVCRLGSVAAELGKIALLVTNAGQPGDGGTVDRIAGLLRQSGLAGHTYRQRGEPTVADVEQALELARREACDVVVGLGGGSALDAAKAVAGLLANGGSPLHYMEVIGGGQKLQRPAVPWVAVPTTAGTGAEVTRNAVIGSPEHRFKASLRSEHLLPRVALVDPELAMGVSPAVTARSGMDALCQLIESYTSNRAQPITDALALQGIGLAARGLARAAEDGSDLDARENMAMAALLSGIALTNVGLGAVHGFAAPVGANYPIPHGTICGLLLPPVVAANSAALRSRSADHPLLDKYAQIGRRLTGREELVRDQAIAAAIQFLEDLVRQLEIPRLGAFGIQPASFPELAAAARKSSSIRYNPVELSDAALQEILHKAS